MFLINSNTIKNVFSYIIVGRIKLQTIACVFVITVQYKLKMSDAVLSIGEKKYFEDNGFCMAVVNTGLSAAHYLEL